MMISVFSKGIEKLSSAGGMAAGISIVLMTGLILLEVILRAVIGTSILVAEEYSAYLLVLFGSMALAYTFKSEGHIRVDLILSKLSEKSRRVVNLACSILGFFVFLFVSWQAWGQFYGSWISKETSMYYSKTPLWLPQLPLFLGTALMALQILSAVANQLQSLGKIKNETSQKNPA